MKHSCVDRIKSNFIFILAVTAISAAGCSSSSSPSAPPSTGGPVDHSSKPPSTPDFAYVRDLAGSATSPDSSSSLSFNVPIPTLSETELEHHVLGDVLFNKKFNTEGGVGPAFNATSCVACHTRDGRGALPSLPSNQLSVRLGSTESLLLRISLETKTEAGATSELVPGYTEQLFHRGVLSLRPDSPGTGQADVDMSYARSTFSYPDGATQELRTPIFKISNGYDRHDGKVSALENPNLRISPRMGPPVMGLGLLEAIDAKDILALADPDDNDGDGISGRANMINGKLGRFGWKANTASLRDQVAGALANDMGLRNPLFPKENIAGTGLFDSLLERLKDLWTPLETEISESDLDAFEFYTATLAVPSRRDIENPLVINGARQFEKIGCTGCHTPHFKTSPEAKLSALRNIDIYPFSDGLLHDMGDELADGRRDHDANGREWKTRPLWGIGKTQTINPSAGFLHDGRARTFEEAILFHGGEAAASRQRFAKLSVSERREVSEFLRSL